MTTQGTLKRGAVPGFTTRVRSAALVVGVVMLGGSAYAQLSKHDQKCIDAYNNGLRVVSQRAGKSARNCIKNAGKGKETDPENCVVNNTDGKLDGKEAKVNALFAAGGKCDPQPAAIVPPTTPAATGISAHEDAIETLTHMMFGSPVTGVISPGDAVAKCQDEAIQRATQLFTTAMKAFRVCKKQHMADGSVTSSTTLQSVCASQLASDLYVPDPKDKVAAAFSRCLGVFQAAGATAGACSDPSTAGAAFAGVPLLCAQSDTTMCAILICGAQPAAAMCQAMRDAEGMMMPDCP